MASPPCRADSGVQGINGELLISNITSTAGAVTTTTVTGVISETPLPTAVANTSTNSLVGDQYGVLPTDFRRFESIAFDQYGYFAQGANIGGAASTTATTGVLLTGNGSVISTGPGGSSGSGVGGVTSGELIVSTIGNPAITLPPASAGNLFVSDLGTGMSVSVPAPRQPPAPAAG